MTGPRKLARAALVLALTGALAGCIGLGGGGKAPPTLLNLTASAQVPTGQALNGTLDNALMVLDPETDRWLGVARVAVQVDAANVAYLDNAAWVERPARLFGGILAETIRARGKYLVFSGDDAQAGGRNRLGGRLLAMGYDARGMAVVVRYDAVRSGPGGTVATKRFEASVPVSSARPQVIGPALNKAANDVAAQVADWVG